MQHQPEHIWHATIDASGRILLPAELRHSRQLNPGVEVVLSDRDGKLTISSFDEVLRSVQERLMKLAPADQLWSEELIAERRREASLEERRS